MVYDSESEDRPRLSFRMTLIDGRETPKARARQLMGQGEGGICTATKFQPPIDSSNTPLAPDEVFRPRLTNPGTGDQNRFCIRRRFAPEFSGLRTMCIYTDGACLDNGSTETTPRGGAAFVFKDGRDGEVGFALENKGIDGQTYTHTSNRAELRAVIAALTYRVWYGEGWERMVIVTDSEYVAEHATSSLRDWATRGWNLASGLPVANKDLWKQLLEVLEEYADMGCEVSFWKVPRELNTVADRVAKAGAEQGGGGNQYTTVLGVMV